MALILNKQKVSAYDLPVKSEEKVVEPAPPKPPKAEVKHNSLKDLRKKQKAEPQKNDIKKKEPETPKDINKKEYNFDPNKTYLVCAGKVKEVSLKSKYLLDMLIIEEE